MATLAYPQTKTCFLLERILERILKILVGRLEAGYDAQDHGVSP